MGQISEDYRAALRGYHTDFHEGEPTARTRQRDEQIDAEKERANARIEAVLSPDQLRQLRQISWQIRGAEALFDARLAAELQLTPEQQEQLRRAREENERDDREMLEALKRIRFKNAADLAAFKERYHAAAEERLLAVLAPEQRRRFQQLTGAAGGFSPPP
jgi:hypothetical protein